METATNAMKEAESVMEEKAYLFRKDAKPLILTPPSTPEEVKKELICLSQILKNLSRELRECREFVKEKEKQFSLFANYKYFLQKSQITPTFITLGGVKKKDRASELLEKLEALTPTQLERLEEIEL